MPSLKLKQKLPRQLRKQLKAWCKLGLQHLPSQPTSELLSVQICSLTSHRPGFPQDWYAHWLCNFHVTTACMTCKCYHCRCAEVACGLCVNCSGR